MLGIYIAIPLGILTIILCLVLIKSENEDEKKLKQNIKERKEKYALIEKSLKALEIIKIKNVDIPMVKTCNSVNDYNEWHSQYKEMHLTQQEYDLLKEILQWKH